MVPTSAKWIAQRVGGPLRVFDTVVQGMGADYALSRGFTSSLPVKCGRGGVVRATYMKDSASELRKSLGTSLKWVQAAHHSLLGI
eukprot:1588065-Amphidinium_carterae.1